MIASTNWVVSAAAVRAAMDAGELGEDCRVVYETEEPEEDENAMEGMPCLAASAAAPL